MEKRNTIHNWIGTLSVLAWITGLLYSRALLSISMGVLVLNLLLHPQRVLFLKTYFKSKSLLAISSLFFIYLLSGINSNNTGQWLEYLKINLPYLLLPLAVCQFIPLDKKRLHGFLYCYLLAISSNSIFLLGSYLANFEAFNALYLQGQTIATPILYVRYSLMLALAFFTGVYLICEQYKYRWHWEKYLLIGLTTFVFIFLHILAVRTGLLAVYGSSILLLILYSWKQHKYFLGIGSFIVLLSLPVLSYRFVPSFKNKINYVKWDIDMYFKKDKKHQPADYIRLSSIVNGLRIVQDSPLLGSGIGDLKIDMQTQYQIHDPQIPLKEQFPPVNQFIYILTGMGILGFLLFFSALLSPLFFNSIQRNWFFFALYFCFLFSFVGETSIELQIGKMLFLFFALLMVAYFESNALKSDGAIEI